MAISTTTCRSVCKGKEWCEITKGRDFFEYQGTAGHDHHEPAVPGQRAATNLVVPCLERCLQVARRRVIYFVNHKVFNALTPGRLREYEGLGLGNHPFIRLGREEMVRAVLPHHLGERRAQHHRILPTHRLNTTEESKDDNQVRNKKEMSKYGLAIDPSDPIRRCRLVS